MDSLFSIGGVQRVTAVVAKELSKDFDVTIVTRDDPSTADLSLYGLDQSPIAIRFFHYPDEQPLKERCCKAYSYLFRKVIPQTRLTSLWYSHSSFPRAKRMALAGELKAGGYDVIVGVHAPLAVRLAACRSQLQGTRLVGWIHNSYDALFGKRSTYIGPELRRHYEWQLEKLDATVVLCQNDAAKYPFPTQVVYNPLTLAPGKPSQGTSRKFLAVGRFSRLHKGFDLLIEAFSIFAQKNAEWTLDLVGEGPDEALCRKLIARHGLADRVTIHPFTTDVQAYYSAAQVYVLSSRWEGFGLVLVEAMAHGLPIVSSDLPTSKEIMGDFGLYFENGNVEQLAQRLLDATAIDWQRKSAEATAIARRFDVEKIIGQWKSIL